MLAAFRCSPFSHATPYLQTYMPHLPSCGGRTELEAAIRHIVSGDFTSPFLLTEPTLRGGRKPEGTEIQRKQQHSACALASPLAGGACTNRRNRRSSSNASSQGPSSTSSSLTEAHFQPGGSSCRKTRPAMKSLKSFCSMTNMEDNQHTGFWCRSPVTG